MSFNQHYTGQLTSRQLGRIHSASLEILRDTGMVFGSPELVKLCRTHGLKTSGDTVYFDDKTVERTLEMTPNEFTLLARDPNKSVEFSLDAQVLAPGSGAVYVVDHRGELSTSSRADFIRAAQVAQVLPQMKLCRPLFIPHDVPADRVHAWMMANQILHQDKPYYLMVAEDVRLLSLAFAQEPLAMEESAVTGRAYGLSSLNIISPLYMPEEASRNLMAYCQSGVAFSVTSMPAAGSTAPCSLPATIVMQNCENLGALVVSQLISPGHPVIYGAMGGHNDMKGMRAVYGGPENRLVEMAGGQMARYYGLLSRGDIGCTDAPNNDFQAGGESMFQLFSSSLLPINLLPGCGLLGSFMGGSLEKILMDAELYEYVRNFTKPMQIGEGDLLLEAIKEIGPKGNFLNHPLTYKKFRTEFYEPHIFNRESYGHWQKNGCRSAVDLAHEKVQACLANYREPDIDPVLKKALLKYN